MMAEEETESSVVVPSPVVRVAMPAEELEEEKKKKVDYIFSPLASQPDTYVARFSSSS